MKWMCIDIETLPQGARDWRAMQEAGDFDAAAAFLSQLEERAEAEGAMPAAPERQPVPRNLRDPAKIEAAQQQREAEYIDALERHTADRAAAALDWWRGGSLLASRGEIACIAYSIPGSNKICVTDFDERTALVELDAAMRAERPSVVFAWNAQFDAGFIGQRAIVRDLDSLAGRFAAPRWPLSRDLGLRDSLPKVIDASELWPIAGGRYGAGKGERKLATACKVLGIDHGVANPIDGSQVLDAFLAGRDEDIRAHAAADVRDLVAVVRRLLAVHGVG